MGEKESLQSCCERRCNGAGNHLGKRFSRSNQMASYQQMERVEELVGDLIRFIGKTNVKTTNGENQLAELEFILARLESQYKTLQRRNESILLRLANLERRLESDGGRTQSFLLEGGHRFPQYSSGF